MPNYQYLQSLFGSLCDKTKQKHNQLQCGDSAMFIGARNRVDGYKRNKLTLSNLFDSSNLDKYAAEVESMLNQTISNNLDHESMDNDRLAAMVGIKIESLTILQASQAIEKEMVTTTTDINDNNDKHVGIVIYAPKNKINVENDPMLAGNIIVLPNSEYLTLVKKLENESNKMDYNYTCSKSDLLCLMYQRHFNHPLSTQSQLRSKSMLVRCFSCVQVESDQWQTKKFRVHVHDGDENCLSVGMKCHHASLTEQKFIEYALSKHYNYNSNPNQESNETKIHFTDFLSDISQLYDDQDDEKVNFIMNQGYNRDTMTKLDNFDHGRFKSQSDGFYAYVQLPLELILFIISYLDNKSLIKLFQLCETSNKLMKFICLNKCQHTYVASFDVDNTGGNNDRIASTCTFRINVRIKHICHNIREIDKINIGDLSLIDSNHLMIVIDNFIKPENENISSTNSTVPRFEFHADNILKNARDSLLHCNRYHIISNLYSKSNDNQIQHTLPKASMIKLSLVGYDGNDRNTDGENKNNDIVIWYRNCKKSDGMWREYNDNEQIEIEAAFKNGDEMVVLNDNNDYVILFENESNKLSITNNNKLYQSISNIKWKDSFTKYFYQKNLKSKKYRIVKRVNLSKMQSYVQYATNVIQNYFQPGGFVLQFDNC